MTLLDLLGRLPAEVWLLPPVLILAGIVAIGFTLRQARLRRFRAIADRTGLTVKVQLVNASEIRGTFRGRALVMTLASPRGPTFFRKDWTRVDVDVKNPEYISLKMWRQDFLDTLIIAAGGEEVQVGDAAFDKRFVIRSPESALVRQLFQSRELRDDILRAGINRVELVNSPIEAFYPREERDPEHALLLFTAVTRLADGIDALQGNYRPEIIQRD